MPSYDLLIHLSKEVKGWVQETHDLFFDIRIDPEHPDPNKKASKEALKLIEKERKSWERKGFKIARVIFSQNIPLDVPGLPKW